MDVCRSSLYYEPIILDETWLANMIFEIFQESDCRYGYRKIVKQLHKNNIIVNHKKIYRLMSEMNLTGLYPAKKLKHLQYKSMNQIYPYLLENVDIISPNQVWATDITYIKLPDRFMYFSAVIDLYSRYIISYDLSHSLKIESTLLNLNNALKINTPGIFNTDQGSQYTSNQFINILKSANINISMDHKGRFFDNILMERFWRTLKQECIYYYKPETISDLENILGDFINWYNNKRLHQSLNYGIPAEIYFKN